MKVPMSWFSDYVDIDGIAPEQMAADLTMSGSMVEGVESTGENIINVVTGKILKIEKHPDADKLVVCQVSLGDGQVQIVTGATNVFEGAVVPVAKDGSTLPGGRIKKGKLRGVEKLRYDVLGRRAGHCVGAGGRHPDLAGGYAGWRGYSRGFGLKRACFGI